MTRSNRMSKKVEQYLQLRPRWDTSFRLKASCCSILPRSPTQPITVVP